MFLYSAANQSKITQLPLKDRGENREVVGFQLAMDSHLVLTFCCFMFEVALCVDNGSVIRFGQVHTSLGEARKMSQPGHPGILLNPHFRVLSSSPHPLLMPLLTVGDPCKKCGLEFHTGILQIRASNKGWFCYLGTSPQCSDRSGEL